MTAELLRRPGTSLVEVLVVCALMAIVCAAAAPPLQHGRDRIAVRAARDALAAAIARARQTAVSAGGASLVIEQTAATARIRTADGRPVGQSLFLGEEFGVELEVGSAADAIELSFDGLGIARLANRTLRLRRGSAEAALTISAYGRVRAW